MGKISDLNISDTGGSVIPLDTTACGSMAWEDMSKQYNVNICDYNEELVFNTSLDTIPNVGELVENHYTNKQYIVEQRMIGPGCNKLYVSPCTYQQWKRKQIVDKL